MYICIARQCLKQCWFSFGRPTVFFLVSCRNIYSISNGIKAIFMPQNMNCSCQIKVDNQRGNSAQIYYPFAMLINILCGLLPVAPSHDALLVGVLFLVQSLFIWSSYENITFGFPKGWKEIKLVSIRLRNKLGKVSRTSDFGGSCFHQVARG